MTAQAIFTEMKAEAKTGYIFYIPYTSKTKLTAIAKLVDRFEEDSKLDHDLGVITHEEHLKEMAMVESMRHSIEMAIERNF